MFFLNTIINISDNIKIYDYLKKLIKSNKNNFKKIKISKLKKNFLYFFKKLLYKNQFIINNLLL